MSRKLIIALAVAVIVAAEVLRQLDTPPGDTCCPCCDALADLDMDPFEAEFGAPS